MEKESKGSRIGEKALLSGGLTHINRHFPPTMGGDKLMGTTVAGVVSFALSLTKGMVMFWIMIRTSPRAGMIEQMCLLSINDSANHFLLM